MLNHLINIEGVQQKDSLADGSGQDDSPVAGKLSFCARHALSRTLSGASTDTRTPGRSTRVRPGTHDDKCSGGAPQ